jgi:hypothetical protein
VRRVRVTFIAGQVPRIYAAAIDQKDGRLPERSSLRRGRASRERPLSRSVTTLTDSTVPWSVKAGAVGHRLR